MLFRCPPCSNVCCKGSPRTQPGSQHLELFVLRVAETLAYSKIVWLSLQINFKVTALCARTLLPLGLLDLGVPRHFGHHCAHREDPKVTEKVNWRSFGQLQRSDSRPSQTLPWQQWQPCRGLVLLCLRCLLDSRSLRYTRLTADHHRLFEVTVLEGISRISSHWKFVRRTTINFYEFTSGGRKCIACHRPQKTYLGQSTCESTAKSFV